MHDDAYFMQRAIALAAKGIGSTAPNPAVGCVVVKDGLIVGEGYHQQAGGPHAEVFALRQAKEQAQGATAYVTLEPCSHYGRTPPCALGLIEAGVTRVVAAMTDPNPLVAGRGLALLQDAGISVTSGLLAEQAQQLNPEFLFKMQQQRPLVRLKLAASLDGAVALANGQSQWLTGEAARADVQAYRARSCAILSTAETVKTDKATLTVRRDDLNRLASGELRQPLRVILDRRCRLTGHEPLFYTGGDIVLVHCGEPGSWPDLELPSELPRQVQRWRIGLDEVGQLDLHELFKRLSQEKLNSIFVEAGSKLASSMWHAKLIDELIVYQAPVLLGAGAKPLLTVPTLTELASAPRWQWQDVCLIGGDVRMVARLLATPKP